MNKKLLVVIALLLVTVVSLSSCKLINGVVDFVGGIFNPKVELTDEALRAEKLIDFANGANSNVLFESDGWSNGDVFNVVWKKHNVFYGDGIMRLGITAEKATAWIDDAEVEYNYTAGEARSQNYFHYGDYEVSMKPSANPGTASTFFTCTGPYDTKFVLDENGDYVLDKNGQRVTVANPHDEIDIEFLGQDTTHVQFNFFVDGKGGNEYMYDLGFDASEAFHTYGYRWTETSITWFVDGAPVYKVTTDTSVEEAGNVKIVEKIPQTPGRILTNYWCGNKNAVGWMGLYSGNTKDQGTEYQWIATSAIGEPLNPPEKPDTDGAELDWSKIEAIAPGFQSTEIYTVVNEGTQSNVSYSAVGGDSYLNVEMDITEVAAGKNYVHLSVTNNGDTISKIRVNVNNAANSAINLSATQDGIEIFTDLEWGGSFFEIPAGATAELVVKFGGTAAKLQLMLDSATYGDKNVYAGNLTFDEIKFAAVGDVGGSDTPVDPPVDPPVDNPVETPTTGDTTAKIDGVEVNFGGNTEVYGINANDEDNSVNIKYNKVSDNTYLNVNAGVAAVAQGKSEIEVKIRNNGTETVYITVKLEAAGTVALMEGKMEIPAGEEKTYNGSFTGEAEMLFFFIDTGWNQTTATHAGDVTITSISFSGEQGQDPVVPPVTKVDPIVNISNLTVGNTNGGELIAGTGISAAEGLAIDENGKSIDGFEFTLRLKLGGTLKPDSKHITVKTDKAATIILYAIASSKDAVGRKLQIGTVTDGVFTSFAQTADVSGNDIAKYEFKVDAAGTYYIGSTDSGINLYYIAVSYEEEKPEPDPVPEYTDLYVEFKTENAYTLVAPDTYANSVRVTYSDIAQNSWSNINIWVDDKSEGCNIFSLKVTNHGTAPVSVWVQLKDASGAELVNENKNIAAGAEEVVTFNYEGRAQMIFFFVDSTHEAAAATNAGDITLSELKLGKLSVEAPTPPAGGDDVPPAEPVEGEYLSFTGNECYTLSATSADYVNSIQVTYTAVSDNTYQNVNSWIQDKAAGKFAAGVTIKNNGTETVNITVKLENSAGEATEAKVVLAAGETKTVSLPYSFAPDLIYFFIDSGWSETTATHAGDITISGINFQ